MRILFLLCIIFPLIGCASSPEKQAKAFYEWYTTQLNNPVKPIFFAAPELDRWVEHSTLTRLNYIYRHGDECTTLDADYFTYSQDVSEKWQQNVIVSPAWHVPGGVAVNVMLGAWNEPQMQSWLIVYLVQQNSTWKITRVKAIDYEQYLNY